MPRPKKFKAVIPGIGKILRYFAPQIRKQKRLLSTAFVALFAETAMRLLEPWPLKFIFDNVILPGFDVSSVSIVGFENLNPLVLLTLLTTAHVAISVLRGVFAYSSAVGMAIAATRIMIEIRARLYSHLQRLSLAFHSGAKSGDLLTRVTYDIERMREVTVVAVLPMLTNLLTLVGMLSIMFLLNWELALMAIAVLPIFALSTIRMSGKIHKVARTQRQREGAMAATAAEAIGAIKVVQALGLEEMLESTFASHNKKSLKESAEAQRLRAGQERLVEVLVAIATALVLWRGVQLTLQGAVTPGDLLVFVTYLKVAFKPMRQLAKYTGQIAKATASGERIIDLLKTVSDVRDTRGAVPAPPFDGELCFESVTFAYDGSEQGLLRQISFIAKSGERIALVGPSGGGKSTLVSLVMRFYDPLEGRILIDGHDIRSYTLDSLRRQVSIVLQESVLFAATVRENIAYGSLDATQEQIEAAAQLANAHDFIMALPQGYDTVLGERGATLSGGQRQRIAIARAAIRNAPIVILDEPTTGLDNESEQVVNDALARLTAGKTTLLISHDLCAAETADQVLYIEHGEVLERGTHAQLMRQNGGYARLYQLQVSRIDGASMAIAR
jgi:ATP-binding cassette subfamily B protein